MSVRFVLGIVLSGITSAAIGQIPFVQSLSKTSARTQETISLKGINFGTNKNNIKVFFGGVSVTPQTISDQFIEVAVPAGAAYENVQVTNTSSGLTGSSGAFFNMSFGGASPFDLSAMAGQFDFQSENGLYDLATADFDGDGKLDVVTANDNATLISLFQNTSSAGSISFTKTQLNPASKTLHVAAGDLNGDGKPEIIASELNAERVFIFKNNCTPGVMSFSLSSVKLTGSKSSSVRISDLDLDGKPELIVTDQSTSRVFIVPNQSTPANLSFSAPIALALTGTSGTDGIAIGDLNGDQFPELVISEFLNANGKIFILTNQSIPGNFNLSKINSITLPSTLSSLRVGDLDGDGKADIAASLLLSSNILVMGNQSSSAEIVFAPPVFFEADEKPWGIEFGDVDGDGKTDIVVASITQKSLTILNNTTTTAGSFAFQKQTKTTTFINRHVRIADMDNDGRPDFTFTSINDNNLGIPASKVSVFRNVNCVLPLLTPDGPLTICNNFSQRITSSSVNAAATYEWFNSGTSTGAPGPNPFFDVTQSGTYTVTVTSDAGACVKTSAGVQVNVIVAAPLGAATPAPVTPVCIGGTLNLSVNDVSASDYVWTGPGGFTAHGRTATRNNFTAAQAGKYKVDVIVNGCITQQETVVVDAVSIPGVEAHFLGADLICEGQTKVFSVSPVSPGYTYQWVEQTAGVIAGETNVSYTATKTGKYFVRLTSVANTSCAPIETTPQKIRIAKVPVVDFTLPAAACLGSLVNFVDKSVVDIDAEDKEVNYSWTFGDNGKSTLTSPSHTYATAADFKVNLNISYRNNACPSFKEQVISVVQSPALAIKSSTGSFNVCTDGSIELQVTATFSSYKWSTGETTASIQVKQPGDYSVEVASIGCKTSTSQSVGTWPDPVVKAEANPTSVNLGEVVQLTATGLSQFQWKPGKTLSDSLIAAPKATPALTTTYTVSGKDANGCQGQAEVEVIVIPESVLKLLHPASYFTPNGDGINDFWKVENIQIFDECAVTIYDEKGLKLYGAQPYPNNWDGVTSKGQVLSTGVYYYIIQCESVSNKVLSGSINIVR